MMPISAWIIAHQKEEWRLPRDITGPIVMRKLCHWEISSPIVLLIVCDKAQKGLKPLVGALGLAVRSGMIGCRNVLLYTRNFA